MHLPDVILKEVGQSLPSLVELKRRRCGIVLTFDKPTRRTMITKGCIRIQFPRPGVSRLVVLSLSSSLALLLLYSSLMGPQSPSALHQVFLHFRHVRSYPILRRPRCCLLHPPNSKLNPGPSHDLEASRILLLLAIKSHPANSDRRAAIRATWGGEREWRGQGVRRVFLLGLGRDRGEEGGDPEVGEESESYGDILQWGFRESFYNVTLKEVLFWNWFHQECSTTILYILKGDDDVYVDVERVVGFLQNRERGMRRGEEGETEIGGETLIRGGSGMKRGTEMKRVIGPGATRQRGTDGGAGSTQPLYMGRIFVETHPVRIWWNKYYVPYSLYPGPYPPYAGGGGYLLSRDALSLLLHASTRVPLFPIDDAYVGMVAQAANLPARHHPGFMPVEYSPYRHPCHFLNSIMVLHKLLPTDLFHLWNFLQTQVHSCKDSAQDGLTLARANSPG
uniref:Hexosyltransferase n=1 Tax=Hucho hucho TaxID=62062 RepID=A0A4W5KCM4_9TELE